MSCCKKPGFFFLIKHSYHRHALFLLEKDLSLARRQDDQGRLGLHYGSIFRPGDEEVAMVPLISRILALNPQAATTKDDEGNIPIHCLLKEHVSFEGSFQCAKALVDASPEILAVKTQFGSLPLHLAARKHESELVDLLLTKYPAAASSKDNDGMLPLHWAVDNPRLSGDAFKKLLNVSPGAATVRDNRQNLPIHYACSEFLNGRRSGASSDVIKVLAKSFPQGVRTPDANGMLPLHLAASWACSETIKCLIDHYPEGAKKPNLEGNLPLHLAAARSKNSASVQYLISQYEQGLLQTNRDQARPIDLCSASDDMFMLLATSCPQSLLQPKEKPFAALIQYLRKHNLAQHRAQKLQELFIILEPHFNSNAHLQNENNQQMNATLQEQKRAFKAAERALKASFDKNTELKKEHAAEMENIHTSYKTWMSQFGGSLNAYKSIVASARESERMLLTKLKDDKSEESTEALKLLAKSIKGSIDVVKAQVSPNSKPSPTQVFFPAFISSPSLSKEELVTCIETLDAELVGLEADLKENVAHAAAAATAEVAPVCATTSESGTGASRPSKRARVSLP